MTNIRTSIIYISKAGLPESYGLGSTVIKVKRCIRHVGVEQYKVLGHWSGRRVIVLLFRCVGLLVLLSDHFNNGRDTCVVNKVIIVITMSKIVLIEKLKLFEM